MKPEVLMLAASYAWRHATSGTASATSSACNIVKRLQLTGKRLGSCLALCPDAAKIAYAWKVEIAGAMEKRGLRDCGGKNCAPTQPGQSHDGRPRIFARRLF